MKKSLIFILLLNIKCLVFSQMNISTSYVKFFKWDENKDEWGDILFEDEEYTFFEFNEEMTFLNLTTTTGKFSYILSDGETDEINDQYTFNMVNKEGTEILLIMDIKSDTPNIRLLLTNNETSLLLRRTIKHVWYEE